MLFLEAKNPNLPNEPSRTLVEPCVLEKVCIKWVSVRYEPQKNLYGFCASFSSEERTLLVLLTLLLGEKGQVKFSTIKGFFGLTWGTFCAVL